MHHGTCVTHVPWCMSGSLTAVMGKTFPASPAHAHPQFRVSGKRPMGHWDDTLRPQQNGWHFADETCNYKFHWHLCVRVLNKLLDKQLSYCWFGTPWRSRDVTVMIDIRQCALNDFIWKIHYHNLRRRTVRCRCNIVNLPHVYLIISPWAWNRIVAAFRRGLN